MFKVAKVDLSKLNWRVEEAGVRRFLGGEGWGLGFSTASAATPPNRFRPVIL